MFFKGAGQRRFATNPLPGNKRLSSQLVTGNGDIIDSGKVLIGIGIFVFGCKVSELPDAGVGSCPAVTDNFSLMSCRFPALDGRVAD